jgi:hypothetical protein
MQVHPFTGELSARAQYLIFNIFRSSLEPDFFQPGHPVIKFRPLIQTPKLADLLATI